MSRAIPSLAALACLTALAACGGGAKKVEQAEPRRAGAGAVDPRPRESVDDAIDRIRGAATASGCDAVKGLLHSTYGQVSDVSCRAVKAQIDGFRDPRGAGHQTGATVEYETATGRRRAMALVLDSDRTYRLAFIDDVPAGVVGTDKPAAFDRTAAQVVAALRRGDCDAFLRLAHRSIGLGVGSDRQVCRRVSDVPFRRELLENRRARPVALSGDSRLAYYKLRTARDAYYTMVMERVDEPGGGARYVLVNALPAG